MSITPAAVEDEIASSLYNQIVSFINGTTPESGSANPGKFIRFNSSSAYGVTAGNADTTNGLAFAAQYGNPDLTPTTLFTVAKAAIDHQVLATFLSTGKAIASLQSAPQNIFGDNTARDYTRVGIVEGTSTVGISSHSEMVHMQRWWSPTANNLTANELYAMRFQFSVPTGTTLGNGVGGSPLALNGLYVAMDSNATNHGGIITTRFDAGSATNADVWAQILAPSAYKTSRGAIGQEIDLTNLGTLLTNATATAALSGTGVNTITVNTPGSAYWSIPRVVITAVSGGSGATATAVMAGSLAAGTATVASITVTAAGTGYLAAPTISFAGGGDRPSITPVTTTSPALSTGANFTAALGIGSFGGSINTAGIFFTAAAFSALRHGILFDSTVLASGAYALDCRSIGASGGRAIALGNNVGIYGRNQANAADFLMMFPDTANRTVLSSDVGIAMQDSGATLTYLLANTSGIAVGGPANGQSLQILVLTEEKALGTGTSTFTTTIQIPAGAVVLAVSTRVTGLPATAATYSVGVAGATTRYATGVSTALGTTDFGTGAAGVTPIVTYTAATSITLTTNANPTDTNGKIRVTIHYYRPVAPTS